MERELLTGVELEGIKLPVEVTKLEDAELDGGAEPRTAELLGRISPSGIDEEPVATELVAEVVTVGRAHLEAEPTEARTAQRPISVNFMVTT